MTEYKTLTLEKSEGIAILKINRPKMLNALSLEVLQELTLALDAVEIDPFVHVLILTGSGEKAFVAGADITEMKEKNAIEGRDFSLFGNAVFSKLEQLRQPTIAAVNGFALGGGCELALACDIRIGAENAKFGQPEVGLGIIPGFGGTQRLPRLIGIGKAKELIYTGTNIAAEEAYRIGLLNKVVAAEELIDEAKAMAEKVMKNSPLGVEGSKKAINQGLQMNLQQALALESEIFGALFATEDQKEGMAAFIEKRKAQFGNK
ncbi:enoyl-CoA hydratase-related protein [Carnobacterium antarcticum]|uniref:Enoyl-CoA hydratase-related protein n=1 Tax=Carnobacterium antarcticum TaxID=2126436 RepID=A0ABW4NKK0_9LACT|nr:enoyl-CoA hydratase-related protein [Carnobacterium sp. CP1]ALV22088.1 Enoyl-CoA hydratase [Carnobacterium sp. CP1]